MDWIKLGFAVVNALLRLSDFLQRQKWYQDGKAAAYAEMDAEQRKRLELADAARRDADALYADAGRLRDDTQDPYRRD